MSDKPASMTARQETWFASVLENLERETGKTTPLIPANAGTQIEWLGC